MKFDIILNGFNKKAYLIEEVKQLLTEIGMNVYIDVNYNFEKAGRHFYIKPANGFKKKSPKRRKNK